LVAPRRQRFRKTSESQKLIVGPPRTNLKTKIKFFGQSNNFKEWEAKKEAEEKMKENKKRTHDILCSSYMQYMIIFYKIFFLNIYI